MSGGDERAGLCEGAGGVHIEAGLDVFEHLGIEGRQSLFVEGDVLNGDDGVEDVSEVVAHVGAGEVHAVDPSGSVGHAVGEVGRAHGHAVHARGAHHGQVVFDREVLGQNVVACMGKVDDLDARRGLPLPAIRGQGLGAGEGLVVDEIHCAGLQSFVVNWPDVGRLITLRYICKQANLPASFARGAP